MGAGVNDEARAVPAHAGQRKWLQYKAKSRVHPKLPICGTARRRRWGIIYLRHDVPILTFGTMKEYIEEGVPPFIFTAPGGLYARIDPEAIRKARRERGLSLGALADIAGVSRKAIQMYELGTMSATLPVVDRLEKYLGEPIVTALNPFGPGERPDPAGGARPEAAGEADRFREGVFEKLQGLGYTVVPTRKSPFAAISERNIKATILLTGVGAANKAFSYHL